LLQIIWNHPAQFGRVTGFAGGVVGAAAGAALFAGLAEICSGFCQVWRSGVITSWIVFFAA
jgi:hypothetical protein